MNVVQTITVYALPVLFAVTLHEAAHGYVARHFGDNTAYAQGRITLNPLKHIDLIGTIVLPLVLALLPFGFVFGYAKPVPVNFANLRNPKRDMVWVALAGPGANLVQALLWQILILVAQLLGVREGYVYAVGIAGITVNCIVFAFNLLPVPPLDGGRVAVGLLPTRAAIAYSRVEPYGIFIVLALMAVPGLLSRLWLAPVVGILQFVINLVTSPLR